MLIFTRNKERSSAMSKQTIVASFNVVHLLSNVNPLSPNSDENEISLYIITTC